MKADYWNGGETYHIVNAMRRAGNVGIIAQWKASVEVWAKLNHADPDAASVRAWLPLWQPRPFYTAQELAPLWPALGIATGFTNRWPTVLKCAERLSNELDFHGLPRLRDYREYFICERIRHWSQAPREDIMREIPHAFG